MSARAPGEDIAVVEEEFWATRRELEDLDDDRDASQRRQLIRRARRMHQQFRDHRYAKRLELIDPNTGPPPPD